MTHPLLTSNALLEAVDASFVWQEHIGELLATAILCMVPAFEGRYAITTCILTMDIPPVFAYFFALVCSTIPMFLIMLLLRPMLNWFYTLPIKPAQKFAAWLEKRSARKREKMNAPKKGFMGWLNNHFSADTMELIALYVFVALPLPGTGVWTGSAIATLFEMPRVKSGVAIFLGNVTACLIMTLTTTGVISIF